jgi:hypothetical protein
MILTIDNLADGRMEVWKVGRREGLNAEALDPFASLRTGCWNPSLLSGQAVGTFARLAVSGWRLAVGD